MLDNERSDILILVNTGFQTIGRQNVLDGHPNRDIANIESLVRNEHLKGV